MEQAKRDVDAFLWFLGWPFSLILIAVILFAYAMYEFDIREATPEQKRKVRLIRGIITGAAFLYAVVWDFMHAPPMPTLVVTAFIGALAAADLLWWAKTRRRDPSTRPSG